MKKNNKVLVYGILLVIGIIIFLTGGFFIKDNSGSFSGVCIGIGAGLFGMSLGQIISIILINKNPSYEKKINIEKNDERNIQINNKAKSKAFDIMGFLYGVLMFIYILIGTELLQILLLVGSYLLVYIIYIIYFNKYYKEI